MLLRPPRQQHLGRLRGGRAGRKHSRERDRKPYLVISPLLAWFRRFKTLGIMWFRERGATLVHESLWELSTACKVLTPVLSSTQPPEDR